MKIKTSELTGVALDWAVAKCEDESVRVAGGRVRFALSQFTNDYDLYSPSTDWAQGGPIIEREHIAVWWDGVWHAKYDGGRPDQVQDAWTPLIAAMRALVQRKLGDEIDIPKELT